MSYNKLIVIGGSAGSLLVIKQILKALPGNFVYPIVVVLHLYHGSETSVIQYLNKYTRLEVRSILDKEIIQSGNIYLAPDNYHVLLETKQQFALSCDAPLHFCRPAIDVFFTSVADIWQDNAIAILLSGANQDGAQGLLHIQKLQGTAIVQQPETAEAKKMPKSAVALGVQKQYKPQQIIDYLLSA